mmetsp:Transcript_25058/g.50075  ORF Transcript_25058/g.50075 Transcript_25058/m.50075 type:complete len:114 (-) Transcript_25058:72-413(-)
MHSLARDIMNEFAMDKDSADAPSNRTAAPSDFLYRKARLIAMSCRHAFPPSKCPTGKLDNIAFCLSAAVLWPPPESIQEQTFPPLRAALMASQVRSTAVGCCHHCRGTIRLWG